MRTLYWPITVCLFFYFLTACSFGDASTMVQIISPGDGETYTINDSVVVELKIDASIGAAHAITLYVDDSLLTSLSDYPFTTKFSCAELKGTRDHKLEALLDNKKRRSVSTGFNVVELCTNKRPELDFMDTSMVYANGWDILFDNTTPYLESSVDHGELLFDWTFDRDGSIALTLKNTTGDLSVYKNSQLLSNLFPVNSWKTYYFHVSKGINTFKIQYSHPGLTLKSIAYQEGIYKHSIGEYWGGGVVVLVDSTFEHGTVASEKDIGEYQWGCSDFLISKDNSGVANSDGWYNTMWIVDNCPDENSAAHRCSNFSLSRHGVEYSDWYLPTTQELKAVYSLRDYFDKYWYESYWTSYAYDTYAAGLVLFTNGSAHGSYRYTERGVLPVRRF